MMNDASSLPFSLLFFQQAAILNNDGINALVNEQNITFAITSMSKAVKLMKLAFAAAPEPSSTSTTSTSSNSNSHHFPQEQHHHMNVDYHEDTYSSSLLQPLSSSFDSAAAAAASAAAAFPIGIEIPSMESSDTIVFNQLLQVPIPHSKFTGTNENLKNITLSAFEINIYASAVVFNLALIHQYLGSSQKESMVKAETLYGMVLRLLDTCSNHTSSPSTLSISFITMRTALLTRLGSMNNLSQICLHHAGERSVRTPSVSSASAIGDRRGNSSHYQQQERQQDDYLVHHNRDFGPRSSTTTTTTTIIASTEAAESQDGGFAGLKRFLSCLLREVSPAAVEERAPLSSSGILLSGRNGHNNHNDHDRAAPETTSDRQQEPLLATEDEDSTGMDIMAQLLDEPAVHGLLLLNVLMCDSPCSVAPAA